MHKIITFALALLFVLGTAACKRDDPYEGMEPSGKPVTDILGVSSHMSKSSGPSSTRDFEIEKLAQAGVSLVRTDFHWSAIEPVDDEWHFGGFDVMVDLGGDAGLTFNAILDYGVDWAMPGGSHDEIEPEVWADFVGQLAAHFADRIDVYEVWNEQNTGRFWRPAPNPERYGRLLEATHEAVHRADPEATVLFGGMSSMDGRMFGPDGLWNFLVSTAAEHPDLCDWFDGMAIHPYTFLQQMMPEAALEIGPWYYPDFEAAILHARELLERIGCPDKPIHLTEMGWPDLLLSVDRQGAYLARGLLLSASLGVHSFYWYTFWDGDGNASLPTEDTFGLFTWPRDDPREKPSYRALRTIHELVGSSRFAGDLAERLGWNGTQRALAFVDEEGVFTVGLWHAVSTLGEAVEVTVPLHTRAVGTWQLFDQEGTLIDSGSTTDGEVETSLNERVHYLRFATDEAR